MKLLITGATGFVGSHFTNAAIAAGHRCVAIRRDPDRRPRVAISPAPTWLNKSISQLDASDFDGIDCLVHLAAHSANVPYDSIEACLLGNVTEPLAMIRSAVAAGVKRFVVAGSCFEYGAAGQRYEFIPTDAPLEATLSYPLSKAVASRVLAAAAIEGDAAMSYHRIFQVYGPGEPDGRLWPSLKRAAQRGEDFEATAGQQVRDFVDVREVARQLSDAVDRIGDADAGQVSYHHIGTGKPQTVRQFTQRCWGAMGGHRAGKIWRQGVPRGRSDEVRPADRPIASSPRLMIFGQVRPGPRWR